MATDSLGRNWLQYRGVNPDFSDAWSQYSMQFSHIPSYASGCKIVLAADYGFVGSAWIDDVRVEILDELVLRPFLRYPNYRSTVLLGDTKPVVVGVTVKDNRAHALNTLGLEASIVNSDGRVVELSKMDSLSSKSWENLSFNAQKLPAGTYRVVVKLVDKASREQLKSSELALAVSAAASRPKVHIDEHNRCVVDGTLFFPFGVYTWNQNTDAELDVFQTMKLNCLINYQNLRMTVPNITNYLDAANARGIKVIVSFSHCFPGMNYPVNGWNTISEVIAGVVGTFKNHPGVLGWYVNDEMTDNLLPAIQSNYDIMRATDPDHPVYQVLMYDRVEQRDNHFKCSDVMGIDEYTVLDRTGFGSTQSLRRFGYKVQGFTEDAMKSRGLWLVGECSSMKAESSTSRPPTFEEMLCMAYQGIIFGARGLIYFCYPWAVTDGPAQIDAMNRLGTEITRIMPVGLGLDAPLSKAATSDTSGLCYLTRVVGEDTYVMAVNPGETAINADIRLGGTEPYTSVSVHTPTRDYSLPVSNNHITESIESLGTRLYKLLR